MGCQLINSYKYEEREPAWKELQASYILQAVEQFALSPTAAAAHIAALAQLTASRSDAATDKPALASHSSSDIAVWGSTVLQAAEEELGRFVEQVGLG